MAARGMDVTGAAVSLEPPLRPSECRMWAFGFRVLTEKTKLSVASLQRCKGSKPWSRVN